MRRWLHPTASENKASATRSPIREAPNIRNVVGKDWFEVEEENRAGGDELAPRLRTAALLDRGHN